VRTKGLSLFILIPGIALLLALSLGYLGEYCRFCDVLSNFKEQIFLASLFLFIATLFTRILRKTNLAALGIIIAVSLSDIAPWYFSDHSREEGSRSYRVSLMNAYWGHTHEKKYNILPRRKKQISS
jgi:hypothetical protein